MTQFLNSFEIDLAFFEAHLYSLDPVPTDDSYSTFSQHETTLDNETDGRAYRYPVDGSTHIALLGADNPPQTVESKHNTTLSLEETRPLDPQQHHDWKVIYQCLQKGLRWYLTQFQGYQYDRRKNGLYREQPETQISGYDIHHGMKLQFDYLDGRPLLTVDSTINMLHPRSLGDYIRQQGPDNAMDRLAGESFLYEPTWDTCTLHSLSDGKTAGDTIEIRDRRESVKAYVRRRHGDKYADKIHDDEPLVLVDYGYGNPLPTAPSLLRSSPTDDRPGPVIGYSAPAPRERWERTETIMDPIYHLQVGDVKSTVSSRAVTGRSGQYDYPELQFGEDGTQILKVERIDATGDGERVSADTWNKTKKRYLDTFGPVETYHNEIDMALFHPAGKEDVALEVYDDLREAVQRYTNLSLSRRPWRADYTDYRELEEWREQFEDRVGGGFALQEPQHIEGDPYFEVIDAVGGKALQHMNLQTYYSKRDSWDYENTIFNTAIGLAVKLGSRPYVLDEPLAADLYMGLNVDGDRSNTAGAVLLSGATGDIIDWTERSHDAGQSSVSPQYVAKKIITDLVSTACDEHGGAAPESLVIHRNGNLGDEEVEGIREGITQLQADDYLPDDFTWQAVSLRSTTQHRIYDDNADDYMCKTGAYTVLDDANVLVATYADPLLGQGTPNPLRCTIKAGNAEMDSRTVGHDVFALTHLDWGSPEMGIKFPLTVHLTKGMSDILQKCSRLGYPPL